MYQQKREKRGFTPIVDFGITRKAQGSRLMLKFTTGFTLIELLVVISIVSLLSSVVLASLRTAREKAHIASMQVFEGSFHRARGDKLIAHFPLNGSLVNLAGTGDALYTGGTATYVNDVPYGSGNSIQFGTGYAYANLNVSETSYSVSLWFKTTNPNSNFFGVITVGNDRDFYLSNGLICAYIYSPSEYLCSPAGVTYNDNKWHHALHTYGGLTGGQEIYVDGKRVAKGISAQSGFTWQTQIRIGTNSAGIIRDVKIYDTSFGGD